jgi:hypothetical protein
MLGMVGESLRTSPGFLMHAAHACTSSSYGTRKDARASSPYVAPNLPDGIRPKLAFQPLAGVLKP